ncbi:MAG: ring-cleaving dioxygenase [Chloroflexi bacterium]|nr:MAG: ring-cleaving dioxygenase [Chloroflexota bacterium]
MEQHVLGIHHVTAITDDPQRNIDFYAGILGLRFVKRTVNFDVPDTYHLYYGDALGHPGTALTFFSWPGYPMGRRGTGQVTTTSFSIPIAALDYWRARLMHYGVQFEEPVQRFDEQVLAFTDHEGLGRELVDHAGAEQRAGWREGSIPAEHAIRGFYNVTLSITRYDVTATLLTSLLGFERMASVGNRTRFSVDRDGNGGTLVDLLNLPGERRGVESIGTVHHVAWRTADDEQQLLWRKKLVEHGLNVTPVMDRSYFHSIYFREPSGVLFEIATDTPGFTVDEAQEALGTQLKLPPWLESQRAVLEKSLPAVHLPY